jgi:hypothetical protein
MSDYSKKTDYELNEAIAVKKGWVFSECIDCHHEYWIAPDGAVDYNESDPPDYTHDWRLCGDLLEEMKCDTYFYDDPETGEQLWMVEKNACWQSDLKRAICEAWLAWKELE